MLKDLNPTVRRFPRHTNEAFPNSFESAQWIERYKAPMTGQDVAFLTVVWIAFLGLATVLFVSW